MDRQVSKLSRHETANSNTPAEVNRRFNQYDVASEQAFDILKEFNQTQHEYPHQIQVQELFELQARNHPEAIAVDVGGRKVTYAELNTMANALAHQLRAAGVKPEDVVALCANRSLDLIVALIAITKAGGAYLPLDPTYPPERLAHMLREAEPKVVLVQSMLKKRLPAAKMQPLILDSDALADAPEATINLPLNRSASRSRMLAYVIFTSGSTGVPKGVMVEHRSLVNLVDWHIRAFGLTAGTRSSCMAAIGFDACTWEIWPPLSSAGTVVLPASTVQGPEELMNWWLETALDVSFVVTPLAEFAYASNRINKGIRTVLIGGDRLRRWPSQLPTGQTLVNDYGPTEATVVATSGALSEKDQVMHIGRPISNTTLYILDEDLKPVSTGVTGELYIGGHGVARGYLNRPELSRERFLADPFSADTSARMYKTGDLGRWRADGTIEYLGRNDHQVKIRGFRIELGEIEAQCLRHKQVKEALVVVCEDNVGEPHLVAYITFRGPSSLSPEQMRADLLTKLPNYMVPRAFVTLDRMPLTLNGKLDRDALPPPNLNSYVHPEYEAPQGATEVVLADICRQLLSVEKVGRHDNLFSLGAHSLMIVHMLDRFRSAGLSMDVGNVYANPTIAGLANELSKATADTPEATPYLIPLDCNEITPQMLPLVQLDPNQIERIASTVPHGVQNIQDIYPLTPLQAGLMFHYLLDRQSGDAYVLPMLLSISSSRKLKNFISALQKVIDRHEALRTAVLSEQLPEPLQVVYRRASLDVLEVTSDPTVEPIEQLRDLMRPGKLRLDMSRAPLMRLYVINGGEERGCYALLLLHHLTHDHDSIETMLKEVTAFLEDRGQTLADPVPFRNHVDQSLKRARTHDAEAFFRGKLGDIDEPSAPFGLLDVHGDGSRIEQAHRQLEPVLSKQIRLQARSIGMSPATLFHAAWALVVAATSGRDDVVFGTVLLGRMHGDAGAQNVLGMFVNTLPLRLKLAELTARSLIESTQRELVELLQHEQASLAAARRCSGIAGSKPLFTTILNYLHSTVHIETGRPQLTNGIQVIEWQEWTNYPIVLSIHDHGDAFVLAAQVERRIDPHQVLSLMSTALQTLVGALQAASPAPVLRLPIMPPEEFNHVVGLFNATATDYPREASINQLFEELATRVPHAVAVVFEKSSTTYAQLNVEANRLARYLRDKGVKEQECVPVIMSRCTQMLIAQLAILKCAAVYVPIDPSLPIERQAFMIQDCGGRVIVAKGDASPELSAIACQWISYEEATSELAMLPGENLDMRVSALAPAYVMYTSGSTGAPKGVLVPHRAVVRLVIDTNYAQIVPTDCVAHCSNPAFDASTFEIWAALLNGARLLIVPPSIVLEGKQLSKLLQANGVTVLWMTVGLFNQYVEVLADSFSRLRYLLVGGDVLDRESIRKLLLTSPPDVLLNGYGPTECTTFSTTHLIQSAGDTNEAIPIGKPIANTQVYILNGQHIPVPIGAPGEIFIGGAGVALGYLNQPALTATRFLPDPFAPDATARMYRSGDLGRWRPDGSIEFMGRNDDQVKIRGYRIELGEIQAQLLKHPLVKEAVVVAREDEIGDKRIVAYVVADLEGLKAAQGTAGADAGEGFVGQWQTLYEETYASGPMGPSFIGWNSSFTGRPIPEPEMQEWLRSTLDRIQELRPRRVLEIGCGVGLLLQHLAPHCASYVGTDFSAAAIEQLRSWIVARPELQHVELLHRAATELHDFQRGSFDTIVLNSVIQYFPDIDYLLTTLHQATRLLTPDGRIFIGDVRHLGLLSTFHSAVQLSKASASISVSQLRRRIARAVSRDKELVVDPQFFIDLGNFVPGISHAQVQLKRGYSRNELTRYRYDVVLYTGSAKAPDTDYRSNQRTEPETNLAQLETVLKEKHPTQIHLRSITNARIAQDVAAAALIESSPDFLDVNTLRRRISQQVMSATEPEALWNLAAEYGYDAEVTWDQHSSVEHFEVVLTRLGETDRGPRVTMNATQRPLSTYANDPLEFEFRQQFIPQLREFLKSRLPGYMSPAAWVSLRQLPLTSNGKVDRHGLPVPQDRPDEAGDYVEPRTHIQSTLANIWGDVLKIDQVGIRDNFFDLGGHSLLATQVVNRIGSALSIEMPLKYIFEFPTIEQLSSPVESLREMSLIAEMDSGNEDIRELLEDVASMPESQVQELMQKLSKESRS